MSTQKCFGAAAPSQYALGGLQTRVVTNTSVASGLTQPGPDSFHGAETSNAANVLAASGPSDAFASRLPLSQRGAIPALQVSNPSPTVPRLPGDLLAELAPTAGATEDAVWKAAVEASRAKYEAWVAKIGFVGGDGEWVIFQSGCGQPIQRASTASTLSEALAGITGPVYVGHTIYVKSISPPESPWGRNV
jgi:hypothetical protein